MYPIAFQENEIFSAVLYVDDCFKLNSVNLKNQQSDVDVDDIMLFVRTLEEHYV